MIESIHYRNQTLVVTPEEETQYNSLKTELERTWFVRGLKLKRLQKELGMRT